jgi:hypothetical protein
MIYQNPYIRGEYRRFVVVLNWAEEIRRLVSAGDGA